MTTRLVLTALSAMAAATLSAPVNAQVDPAVSLNFYLTESAYSGCGLFDDSATSQCEDLAFSPRPGPAQLWVVVSREDGYPDGLASVGFGVIHDSLEVQSWITCTGGAFYQGFG